MISPRTEPRFSSSDANSGSRAAKKFLVNFGDFARQSDGAITENLRHVAQGFENAVRAFVGDHSCRFVDQRLQRLAAGGGFGREESDEAEIIAREAGCGKRGQKSRGSRQRDDRNSMLDRGGNDPVTGVGNQRRPGIAHESDRLAALQGINQFRGPAGFIVLVIAQERLADFKVLEQFLCLAGVFARNDVRFFAQNA